MALNINVLVGNIHSLPQYIDDVGPWLKKQGVSNAIQALVYGLKSGGRIISHLGGKCIWRQHDLSNGRNDDAVAFVLGRLELTYPNVIGMNRSSVSTAWKLSRIDFDDLYFFLEFC